MFGEASTTTIDGKIVLVILGSIAGPFYASFLLVLIKRRKKEPFNSAFFRLCLSIGVADLGNLFHAYLFSQSIIGTGVLLSTRTKSWFSILGEVRHDFILLFWRGSG